MTENLGDAHSQNIALLSNLQADVTEFLTDAGQANVAANNAALERVSALAQSTSLQGQDLVAKSASDMVRYISIALGAGISVIALIMIIGRSK